MQLSDKQTIQRAVQIVAGQCDGAHQQDGQGFNGGDAEFGRSIANAPFLSDRQAVAALKMVLKYKRQIGPDLHTALSAISSTANASTANSAVSVQAPAQSSPEAIAALLATLPWSTPRTIDTRAGARLVSEAEPTPEFWNLWKVAKEEIKGMGYSVGKSPKTGLFVLTRWQSPDGTAAVRKIEPKPDEAPAKLELPEVTLQPWIEAILHDWQRQNVRTNVAAIMAIGCALDGSGTGAGKTVMGLATAYQLGLHPLVVCPKATIPGWTRTAARLFNRPVTAINWEGVKTGKTEHGRWVVVDRGTKKEREVWQWTVGEDTLIIFDEAHRGKSPKSINQELMIAAADQAIRSLDLSATIAKDPMDMRAVGYQLKLFTLKDYYSWLFKHGCVKGRFGIKFDRDKPENKQHIRKLHGDIFGAGRGSRIDVNNVPGFPEVLIVPEVLDFNGASKEIQRAYDDMQEALSRLDEVEAKDRQGIILTEILRARQRSELLKIPTIATMTQEAIAEGIHICLFVNFDETVNQLAARLKTNCVIRGGQSDDERTRNNDRFQEDLEPVIICNIRAGGVGINLHDVRGEFPRESYIMPTYSGDDTLQAIGRTRRDGGKSKAVCKIMFALGTIEEEAARACESKIGNISLLNDGDLRAGFKIFN